MVRSSALRGRSPRSAVSSGPECEGGLEGDEIRMRVLVTGGTGYLGGAIVRALHRHGHEPVIFARHASAGRLPGRAIDGDIRDSRAVDAAAAGVDAVVRWKESA